MKQVIMIEKQNQESCVWWGTRLQWSKQKCLEESFPGQVGEGSLGRASCWVSACSTTCKEKLELHLSASAVVLPQQASGAGRVMHGSYRLWGRWCCGSSSLLTGARCRAVCVACRGWCLLEGRVPGGLQ